MNKSKLLGQTFTEFSEVQMMTKLFKKKWMESKIIEPSFGSGHFLIEIISCIIDECREERLTDEEISELLANNVWGYEIDETFYNQAMRNIDALFIKLHFNFVSEFRHLYNSNSFDCTEDNFDLVIGNPPYVRIQNLDSNSKEILKGLKRTSGNTDLYLMFIDFYLDKLSEFGEFIFVVPNSLGKSKSAKVVRDWMFENGTISYFDFEDMQIFPKVSVYSCIFHFIRNVYSASKFITMTDKKEFKLLNNDIFNVEGESPIIKDLNVKNGVATLADSVFVSKRILDLELLFPIFKASRQNQTQFAIFPYKIIGDRVERFKNEQEFKSFAPKTFNFLLQHKAVLLKRSLEKNAHWFEYGRSQAIKDFAKEKFVIDTLIKPGQKKLNIWKISKNTLVYSGLYTTSDEILKINSQKLLESLRFSAKDMRGGYKKISSSMLKVRKDY